MRRAFIAIGICILTAACSGQPFSPTSLSGVTGVGAQTQTSGGAPVEVTFTKWSTGAAIGAGIPTHTGISGGDVPGTFAGTVLSRDAFENGTIVQLEARYEVIGANPAQSFKAHIEGKQNNETRQAVLNGTVIDGWLVGAQVHVTYDVIDPAPGTSCVPEAPVNRRCFQGTIRILPGSAD
jgi:hypothetical protein